MKLLKYTSKLFILISISISNIAMSTTYNVGPGQTYSSIGQVPTHSLLAGDSVKIHFKSTPYFEKFFVNGVGTASNPIVIIGIPDNNGNKPILDGQNAISSTQFNFWNEDRQIIKVGQGSNADYIIIEGFIFRNANNNNTYTDDQGVTKPYIANACAVRPENCNNITVRNCEIYNCGNGLQGGSGSPQIYTMESCYIHDNGFGSDSNSAYEHNVYANGGAGSKLIVQYCRFGTTQNDGQNLKSRAETNIIRYNWIEGGNNRQLDLVEDVNNSPNSDSYVYGNIIIKTSPSNNHQIVHWGKDGAGTPSGVLHFYNNTVYNMQNPGTYFLFSSPTRTAIANNNIFYTTTSAYLYASNDVLTGENNWVHSTITLSSVLTSSIIGTDPLFADQANSDFHLMAGSPCIDIPNVGDPAGFEVDKQYVNHLSYQNRVIVNSNRDIGAYEYNLTSNLPEIKDEDQITVWPNPFSKEARINFTHEQKNLKMKLLNSAGTEIENIDFNGSQYLMQRGEMPSGIYFLQIYDEIEGLICKKIILD